MVSRNNGHTLLVGLLFSVVWLLLNLFGDSSSSGGWFWNEHNHVSEGASLIAGLEYGMEQ